MSIVHEGNRQKLLANPHVESLSQKHISYTKEFMLNALKLSDDGIPAPSIWADSGFDLADFKRDYFRKCIARWKKQYFNGDFVHKKRGPQISEILTRDEEIAFLRAENAVLKELRALGVQGVINDSGLSLELYRKIVAFHAPDSVNWPELAREAIINGWQDLKRD